MTQNHITSAIEPPRLPLPGKLRIAIVSPDILGPIKNGGVGTAYWEIATLLARAGHGVTIFFTPNTATSVDDIEKWQELYLSHGVALLPATNPVIPPEGYAPLRRSYAIYEQLRQYTFDVIHFPDMYGLGYFSIRAKKAGLDFQATVLAVQVHGPNSWHFQFNEQEISTQDELYMDYMERKSIELADELIVSHGSVLDWLKSRRWGYEAEVSTLPLPCEAVPVVDKPAHHQSQKPNELVFFGRIEARKGVQVFCDALDLIAQQDKRPTRVSFLGKRGMIDSQDAAQYVRNRSTSWPFQVSFLTDYDRESALEYLREGRKVAILPTRAETFGYALEECLRSGIRFIASHLPVFVDRVDERFHQTHFFNGSADDLTDKILHALQKGISPASLKKTEKSASDLWLAWHEQIASPVAHAFVSQGKDPLVSVCISHRNRSESLAQAVKSILDQTYKNFEIIISDDGSDSPAAKSYLDTLAKEFEPRGWKVIRHSNRTGPGACRNRAVAQAQGEYVLLMDDDNLAKPEELETFVRAAQNTGSDLLTCFFDRVSERFEQGHQKIVSRWLCMGDDLSSGYFSNVFGDMNAFVRRSAYLQIGGVSELVDVGGEDWEFFVRAVSAGLKLSVVPRALFYYLDHVASYTRRVDSFRSRMLLRDAYSFSQPKINLSALMSYFGNQIAKIQVSPTLAPRSSYESYPIYGKVGGKNLFLHDESFHRVVFDIQNPGAQNLMVPIRQLEIKAQDGFLELASQGEDPGFELTGIDLMNSPRILVEIDMESPVETTLQLFYRSELNPEYDEIHSISRKLKSGMNVLRLSIDGQKLRGPIRIDPAQTTGDFLLRRLTIRSEI